jgi:hypothetical protein
MNTYETSSAMEELRRIKEECSRERLARTSEEDARHLEEVMKRAEVMLGRPIKTADYSKSAKEAAKAESVLV